MIIKLDSKQLKGLASSTICSKRTLPLSARHRIGSLAFKPETMTSKISLRQIAYLRPMMSAGACWLRRIHNWEHVSLPKFEDIAINHVGKPESTCFCVQCIEVGTPSADRWAAPGTCRSSSFATVAQEWQNLPQVHSNWRCEVCSVRQYSAQMIVVPSRWNRDTTATHGLHTKMVILSIWWDYKDVLQSQLLPSKHQHWSKAIFPATDRLSGQNQRKCSNHGLICFVHNNVRRHVAKIMPQKLHEMRWEVFMHTQYTPDVFPPSIICSFAWASLCFTRPSPNGDGVNQWLGFLLTSKPQIFCRDGTLNPLKEWRKSSAVPVFTLMNNSFVPNINSDFLQHSWIGEKFPVHQIAGSEAAQSTSSSPAANEELQKELAKLCKTWDGKIKDWINEQMRDFDDEVNILTCVEDALIGNFEKLLKNPFQVYITVVQTVACQFLELSIYVQAAL